MSRLIEVFMLNKAFDQIQASDIVELCERGAYESQFKGDLPGDGRRPDAWNAGGKISPTARNGLLREIVAFGNAQGGTLVLGIQETKEKPPRAESISAVSRVHELADRLQEAARACIEPPLGALQVRGIVTRGDSDGVVIFRTSASLTGPHRVAGDGHAFIRRGPSSVQMTMREIQDLTLDLARGAERLESLFGSRAKSFSEWLENSSSGEEGAFRITGVPLGSFPGIPRISADPRAFPFPTSPQQRVLLDGTPVDFSAPLLGGIRPIVRGVRMHAQDDSTRIDISQTGIVDMWFRHSRTPDGKHFYIGWLLASYLRILDLIDSIRSAADAPDFEFALELSLAGQTGTPRFGGGKIPLAALTFGAPNNPHSSWHVDGLPITFPRITSRGRSDHADITRDLFDAAGDPLPWSELALPP